MDEWRGVSQAARVLRPWLLFVFVGTCAGVARTASGEEAVRLQYAAPAECPDAASFATRVRERTPRGRFAEASELARTFNVALVADAQGFVGDLEFLDDSGAKVNRRVHGEQCDAVVSSLALITALALDATLPEESSETVAPEARPAQATPPVAPVASVPVASVPVAPVASVPVAPVASAPAREPAASSRKAARAMREVRLGVLAGYGTAPNAPRLGVLGQVDFRTGLSLRLSAHYSWDELAVDAGRSASLRLSGLETNVCPWSFRWGTFGLSPCAALDLGALRAAGVESAQLTSARAETIWWAALGAQLGASWQPGASFWVELRAAAEFPLRGGYRFTFENPDQTAYQVPYFSGWGAIASGVRFW